MSNDYTHPQTAMPQAVTTALAIPELLEGILLELPPRDLLLATRVNKSFQNQINSSTRIQCKLFFKTAEPLNQTSENGINPFLRHVLRREVDSCTAYIHDPSHADDPLQLGAKRVGLREEHRDHDLQSISDKESLMLSVPCGGKWFMPECNWKYGSWRKMLVTHRPLTITLHCRIIVPDRTRRDVVCEVEVTAAMTIETLIRRISVLMDTVPYGLGYDTCGRKWQRFRNEERRRAARGY